jgi:hypothetical protein
MTNVSKMSELQDALNRYGEVSVQNYKIVHPLGEKIIDGFGGYLGEAGNASGVPPAGDWMSDGRDYRDAKFSTYWEGALKVGTISMGLAVRIPHTKDDGAFYLRVVLDFLVEGHTFSVQIGDGKIIGGLPIDGAPSNFLPVYDEIFAYVKDIFVHPVNYFEAQRVGKIGFLPA